MKIKLLFLLLIPSILSFSQDGLKSITSEISVNPAALDFDTTLVEYTATLQTVVKNTGAGILTVSDITSNRPVFKASPTSFTLSNNQEQIVNVTFTPDDQGHFYGTLSIINNSPTSLVEVICTGEGKWPLGLEKVNLTSKACSISPNPVRDKLILSLKIPAEASISVNLIDLSGNKRELIRLERFVSGVAQMDLSKYIRDLPNGIYILDIQAGNDRFAKKMVKL